MNLSSLLLRSNPNLIQHGNSISRAFLRPLFFSTDTFKSLDRQISSAGDLTASIVAVLDKWHKEEGNGVKQSELQSFINQLNEHRRFGHALQILEWMSDRRSYNLSPADFAVRLDLISEVHGLEQAEKYFDSIPDASRSPELYAALLNSMISVYSKKGLLDKAEAYVNKIMGSGTEPDASTWDHLATGYYVLGRMMRATETIQKAISASKKPGWKPNVSTLAACLEYLKAQGDLELAEELLKMVKEHCHFSTGVYDRLMKCITNENQGASNCGSKARSVMPRKSLQQSKSWLEVSGEEKSPKVPILFHCGGLTSNQWRKLKNLCFPGGKILFQPSSLGNANENRFSAQLTHSAGPTCVLYVDEKALDKFEFLRSTDATEQDLLLLYGQYGSTLLDHVSVEKASSFDELEASLFNLYLPTSYFLSCVSGSNSFLEPEDTA